MSEANEEVMRRFVEEVINNGDYSVLGDLVHPNYVYRSPDQELHGPEALKGLFTAYRTAFPDLNTGIDDLVVGGDKAVISITLTGTHEGDLMGIAATGKKVKVHAMVLSRFEDGKIVEEWEILDMLAMFQQLGVVSLPT
ncbi:MAG: ester cyclase [Gammaproteobacteria bacterium]|nr:ester cyclase [Gammaproteobacteria bacterium]